MNKRRTVGDGFFCAVHAEIIQQAQTRQVSRMPKSKTVNIYDVYR
jgi:D-alanyl-D-alanine dipeptidase